MDVAKIIVRMSATRGRTAGTDAERRTAVWLRDMLHRAGHRPQLQTVWVRPYWPMVHGVHAVLALAGSAVSVFHPALGLMLLLLSLVSMLGDLSGAFFWARRLTPRRATQNLVIAPEPEPGRVRLVLTANLDAGRAGAVYHDLWVRAEARGRRVLAGHLPSPLGFAALAVAAIAVLAAVRLAGASGPLLGTLQLLPSLYLASLLAVLADVALAAPTPGANANASGVAAAVDVFEHLQQPAHAPGRLDVHLVLAGSGEGSSLGLAGFLRAQARDGWRAEDVALVAFEPCGVGRPRFFTHDGPLWASHLHPRLIECARRAAAGAPAPAPLPHISHAGGAAYAARRRGWPALALGALDVRGRPGRARQELDTPDRVDPAVVARCVQLCLALVAELDASLADEHEHEERR